MARIVDLARLHEELNEEQVAAAAKTEGPALILAGAGSGKTRTITYKIAHLISSKGVDPRRILAVTFTNKAAREMKTRIQQILEGKVNLEWMGTFHSI
jgi:DNA helicase-2/ATP-dependent DNA helicase PcrA